MPKGPRSWPPGAFFVLDVVVLVLLLGAAVAFATGLLPELHPVGKPGAEFLSVIPYWVPWAGVLGGTSISLVGVAGYSDRWDANRYAYWHLARPFLGGVFGTIAVLVVVLVLKNVTSVDARVPYTPQGTAVLVVFAYVVGFREETFRSLVRRVVDVILGPGAVETTALIAFVPAVLDFQTVKVGAIPPPSGKVHLFNGSADTVHVTSASVQCGDPSLSVAPPIADTILAPAQSIEMTIVWVPAVGVKPLDSYVSVSTGSRAARVTVRGQVA